MLAKVKENAIKSRKAQEESEIKYEPELIVNFFNFRKLNTSLNHAYYFETYQVKKSIRKESFAVKGKLMKTEEIIEL